MFNNFKNSILILIVFSLCFSTFGFVFYPKKAEATVPTIDAVQIRETIAGWVNNLAQWAKDYAIQAAQWAWEQRNTALKIAIAKFRKILLDMIVNEIITWIQGGGDPKFVTDWEGFLKNAVNIAGASTLEELIGKAKMQDLCNGNWGVRINIALSAPQKFGNNITCTLDQIAANFTNFVEDFHNGSWKTWIKVTETQNNPYGLYLTTLDEKLAREDAEKEASALRAAAGNGLLSHRVCKQQVCVDDHSGQKTISTGSFEENQIGTDCWCEMWETRTPGKVIADGLSKSLFSDVEWLQNNEEWESYVIAISDAIINRLVKEGVAAITSSDVGSSNSPVSNNNPAINQSSVVDTTPPTTQVVATDSWHVEITSNEQATIYYTLDGTTPTINSNIYIDPIEINMPKTLKWFGVDYHSNKEQVHTLNLNPPLLKKSVLASVAIPVDSGSVTLFANKPAIIYYTLDGTTPSPSSFKFIQKINLTQSDFLQWISVDVLAGETESLQKLTTAPPFTTITNLINPIANFTFSGATLNASGSKDPDNVPIIAMYEWDFDNDGNYDWYTADWDRDGNFDESKCTHTTTAVCVLEKDSSGNFKIPPMIGNGFHSMGFVSLDRPWEVSVYFQSSTQKIIGLRVTDDDGLSDVTKKIIIPSVQTPQSNGSTFSPR